MLRPFTIHKPRVIRDLLQGLDVGTAATADWVDEIVRAVGAAEASAVFRTTTLALPTAIGHSPANLSPLTDRELEVLSLVAEGLSHSTIARQLFLSLNTVKSHLRSIRQKLDVERTGEAVAIALASGWTAPTGPRS